METAGVLRFALAYAAYHRDQAEGHWLYLRLKRLPPQFRKASTGSPPFKSSEDFLYRL